MSRPFLILDGYHRDISTSKAQYNLVDTCASSDKAFVIARETSVQEPGEIPVDLSTPPGGKYVRFLLFPLYTIFKYYTHPDEFDLLISNHRSDAVLPALLLNRLTNLNWVILSWDTPDGFRELRQSFKSYSMEYLIKEIMFPIVVWGFQRADLVVSTDDSVFLKKHAQDFTIFPAGADCENINSTDDYAEAESEKVRVIYLGNMYYHRGIDIILDAFKMTTSKVTLDLVGPAPSSSNKYRTGLQESIEEYVSRFENITYYGKLPHDEAMEMVCNSHIGLCLLPYNRGARQFKHSYPIKVFEYMSAGIPIIATKTEALETILTEDQLIPTEDPEELAARIDYLCHNPAERERLGRANQANSTKYCWSSVRESVSKRIQQYRRSPNPIGPTHSYCKDRCSD